MADNTNPVITESIPGQDMPAAAPLAPGVIQTDQEFAHLHHSDASDVFAASWRQNTLVGQAWNQLQHADRDAQADPSFNPYAYLKEHAKDYPDIMPLVANGSGLFDHVSSKEAFDAYVAVQRKNMRDRETIANGDGWGATLSLGASMLDATSLISVGGLATSGVRAGSLLGRAALGSGMFGIDAGLQEAGLRTMDDNRTAEESFMNIGTAMALGAALGPIFSHARPNNTLNPGHPDNALHPDNFDKVTMQEHYVGQVPEEGDSIGAMRATRGNEGNEIAVGRGKVAKAIDWLLASRFTPLGRLTNYKSAAAREGLLSMYDTGGLLTKAMAEGTARPVEAETIKTIFDQRASAVRDEVASIYRQANMDLGQSARGTDIRGIVNTVTLGGKDVNAVPQNVFNEAITLIQHGSNAGAKSADISADVMKHLTDAGLSPEAAKAVHQRVYQAEAVYHKAYEDVWDEAVRIGLADPKLTGEGRYGMPQLWDREAIDRNAEQYRAFMQQHLGTKPLDDWLRDEGWIRDPNKPAQPSAAGVAPVESKYASWDDIVKSGDSTMMNDILRSWRGEEQAFHNDLLDAQLAQAEQRQLRAQENAAEVLQQLGKAETEHRNSKLSEMKEAGRHAERYMAAQTVASAQLRAEKAAEKLQAAVERTRHLDPEDLAQDLVEDLKANGLALDRAGPRIPEAKAQVSEAEQLVDTLKGHKAENVEARRPLTEDTPERRALRRESKKINQDLRDALEKHKAAQDELNSANTELDKIAKEQRDSRRWLDAVTKDIDAMKSNEAEALLDPGLKAAHAGMADRLAVLKQSLEDATVARKAAFALRRQLGQDARKAAKESDRAAENLRKTAFRARKYTADTSPLVKYVDQLVNNLRGNERAPRGLLLDEAPTSGRLKERQFQFDSNEYRQLRESGFLKSNADDAFMGYHQDLGGHIAMHRAMEGRKMDDVIREVMDDYDRMIGSELDPKKKEQLVAEKKNATEDLKAAGDRILGRYDPKDHNGLVWTADMLKKLGIIRYMGGFIFSSVADIAQAAFAAPGSILKTIAFRGSRDYAYILKQAAAGDADMKELARIMGSFETGLHMNMSDKALGRGAVRDHIGFGTGLTRDISSGAEKLFDLTADAGNKLSGLKGWSDNIRRTAGLVQLANIRDWVKGYGAINASKRAQLAALGIGEVEAKRLNTLFTKYGTEQRQGLFSPGMSKWLEEPDGEEMKYVLESALVKAQKRASYTSGYGNQPLLMDKWYGKLFLQFQSQAFQFTNNFLRAGFQHGAVTGDQMRFASALGTAMAAGVLMNVMATYRKGEDINKQLSNPPEFAYNVIQRSGILGWAGSYVDAGVKLTDPVLKQQFGFTLGGGASKFSQNSWLANLMGPWGGSVEALQQIGANAVNGDLNKAGEKALRLLPLNQQFSIIGRIVSTLNQ